MKAWADFHPYILPDVEGCPHPLLDQKLVETVRDFCNRTKAWKYSPAAITATGAQTYSLVLPAGTEALTVLSAAVADKPVKVLSRADLPDDWMTTEPRCMEGLVLLTSPAFTIIPHPTNEVITAKVALRPQMTAEGVDDAFWAEHVEAIAWGAKYRLWSMPRKPWTDLNAATQARGEYETRVHHAANIDWRESGTRRVKTLA